MVKNRLLQQVFCLHPLSLWTPPEPRTFAHRTTSHSPNNNGGASFRRDSSCVGPPLSITRCGSIIPRQVACSALEQFVKEESCYTTGLNGVCTTPSAIAFGPRSCNFACGFPVRRGAIGLPHVGRHYRSGQCDRSQAVDSYGRSEGDKILAFY
jgi:hypothetical protein